MEVITYSLAGGDVDSDRYYRDVFVFTDCVLGQAEERVRPWIEAFRAYVEEAGREAPRSWQEYAFELLTLGVLWRVYAARALVLAEVPRRMLSGLVRVRQRGGRLKPAADLLRGVLGGLFLFPNGRCSMDVLAPTVENLHRLLGWLGATGHFWEEVERLRAWRDFLAERSEEEAADCLATAITFALWFEAQSEAALGRYTPRVERFLAQVHPRYRWREDAIFCGRQRVEYHLSMVGTEVLNRAFWDAFCATARKVVLLPPCMRAQPDEACQARPTPIGDRCVGCTPDCRVRILTSLGEKLGFEVLLQPDELAVLSGRGGDAQTAARSNGELGVVGVSCVLTNVHGGWETRALNVPAQGVPLDYCGCRYHWHREGIATAVNVHQLVQVLRGCF